MIDLMILIIPIIQYSHYYLNMIIMNSRPFLIYIIISASTSTITHYISLSIYYYYYFISLQKCYSLFLIPIHNL